MERVLLIFCLSVFFAPKEAYVILNSCPPGCECFDRNTVVECREAHLKEIPVLKFASNVKRLVLRGNAIENIEPDSLREYKSLESLDLNDNEISMLSDNVFVHNPLLKEVNLGLNPFRCDCDLRGFREHFYTLQKKRGLVLIDADLTNCAEPQTFVGKPLLGITFQDQRKNTEDKTMYIGEQENRGVAFCPTNQPAPPTHAMLKAKPPKSTKASIRDPPSNAQKNKKKKSPNIALITASVTAALLVSCISLASVAKYLRKKNRWRNYRDTMLNFIKMKPLKRESSTFAAKIKKQRRASCGYAPSDCSSDEETTSRENKGKDGYTAVPTKEPSSLQEIALSD